MGEEYEDERRVSLCACSTESKPKELSLAIYILGTLVRSIISVRQHRMGSMYGAAVAT